MCSSCNSFCQRLIITHSESLILFAPELKGQNTSNRNRKKYFMIRKKDCQTISKAQAFDESVFSSSDKVDLIFVD